jgi:hypothetical protein
MTETPVNEPTPDDANPIPPPYAQVAPPGPRLRDQLGSAWAWVRASDRNQGIFAASLVLAVLLVVMITAAATSGTAAQSDQVSASMSSPEQVEEGQAARAFEAWRSTTESGDLTRSCDYVVDYAACSQSTEQVLASGALDDVKTVASAMAGGNTTLVSPTEARQDILANGVPLSYTLVKRDGKWLVSLVQPKSA